jgi:hypothetical protein
MTWARHCDHGFTRVTVLLSTPFPTALVGFQMFTLRRFAPAADASRVSTDANPRAVCQFIGRSVLAARSAGPEISNGRLLSFPISTPSKLGG